MESSSAAIGLQQTIVTALSGPVQEKDNWPFLVGIEIGRHENLIAVSYAAVGDRAVQESGFLFPGEGGQSKAAGQRNRKQVKQSGLVHGPPVYKKVKRWRPALW
jgi:hypothetical protein